MIEDASILHHEPMAPISVPTNSGRALPFGYVQFDSYESAQNAIAAARRKEVKLGENVIFADWFKSKEHRPNKQIFVRHVPAEWSEAKLTRFVERHSAMKIASISTKDGPYGKRAVIGFDEAQHALTAIDRLNGVATGDSAGNKLAVSRFMNKSERERDKEERERRALPFGRGRGYEQRARPPMHRNGRDRDRGGDRFDGHRQYGMYSLYVGDIPSAVTEGHLQSIFESFGKVRTVHILQKTVDFRYGFVNFAFAEDAARAMVSMNGKKVGTKHLQIKPTQKDSEKAQRIEHFVALMQQNRHSPPRSGPHRHSPPSPRRRPRPLRVPMNGGSPPRRGHFAAAPSPHLFMPRGHRPLSMHSPVRGHSHYALPPPPPTVPVAPHPVHHGPPPMHHHHAPPAHAHPHPHSQPLAHPPPYHHAQHHAAARGDVERVNPSSLPLEAAQRILSLSQHVIVWKVQYGEEWHEYNTQLAALTEQMPVGSRTTITLSDSDYLLTKMDEKQAVQQNLTTGTTRKVVRLFRARR